MTGMGDDQAVETLDGPGAVMPCRADVDEAREARAAFRARRCGDDSLAAATGSVVVTEAPRGAVGSERRCASLPAGAVPSGRVPAGVFLEPYEDDGEPD